jgi:uncharacterized protein YkwD
LRRIAVALLAAPVLAVVYLQLLLRRSVAARVGLVFGVGALLGVAGFGALAPDLTTALPPGDVTSAVPSAEFRTTLTTGQGLREPVVLDFSAAMDEASVAAALTVDPPTAVGLTWDASDRQLSVRPQSGWEAGTYVVVTVAPTARDASGQALGSPARAAFLTRPAAAVRFSAPDSSAGLVPLQTTFVVTVEGDVDADALAAAVQVEPAVAGQVTVTTDADPATPTSAAVLRAVFVPAVPLALDTTYTISLADGLTDREGVAVVATGPLSVQTVGAPSVIRFRPFGSATDVAVGANVSVRFDQSMDRVATQAAFQVTADGAAVSGTYAWFEDDHVLVLDPKADFAKGARVVLRVTSLARSAAGVALFKERAISFATVPKPAPAAPRASSSSRSSGSGSSSGSGGGSGGGSVGGGSWAAVETYYLRLMNCTRTGGWVTSSGACSSPGGRSVAALKLDSGISSRVSRPYAKLLATRGACSHFIGGSPGDRLRRAGYSSYRWAENLGCRSGNPYGAVLGSHLFFQSERSYNGGHYVNLMNSKYDRVGIGVWVSSGRVRLVVDFYHP